MYDLVILGAGPAGITAAVYAARKQINFSVVTKDIGGQAALSGDIENYTGYQFITGPELAVKFREHLEKYSFDLHEGIEATKIENDGAGFKIQTSDQKTFSGKTLIIASGKRPRMLGVPGETEFKNKGVTYCATCDGPLFAGKEVAVIGGGNSALDAALQMMKIANKVYLININEKLAGDAIMRKKVEVSDKVEILNKTKTLGFSGDKFLKGMDVEVAGKSRKLNVEGVFVEIGLVPNSDFIDCVKKNKRKEIIVNCGAMTSVPGVYAAGDVTDVPDKQIVIAAGDGAKASLAAFRYLSTH